MRLPRWLRRPLYRCPDCGIIATKWDLLAHDCPLAPPVDNL